MARAVLNRVGEVGRVLGWATGCLEPAFCSVASWTGSRTELTKKKKPLCNLKHYHPVLTYPRIMGKHLQARAVRGSKHQAMGRAGGYHTVVQHLR